MSEWKQAVVIGASGGIGGAIADALEEEGVAVTRFARSMTGDAISTWRMRRASPPPLPGSPKALPPIW